MSKAYRVWSYVGKVLRVCKNQKPSTSTTHATFNVDIEKEMWETKHATAVH